MQRFLYRTAVGALAGVLSGLVCFWTLSVITFAFGLYSHNQLSIGAVTGIVVGGISGCFISLCRLTGWRAAAWPALVLVVVFVGSQIFLLSVGPVFNTVEAAVRSIGKGALFLAVASALTGLSAAWLVARLPESPPLPSGHEQTRPPRPGGQRIYRL